MHLSIYVYFICVSIYPSIFYMHAYVLLCVGPSCVSCHGCLGYTNTHKHTHACIHTNIQYTHIVDWDVLSNYIRCNPSTIDMRTYSNTHTHMHAYIQTYNTHKHTIHTCIHTHQHTIHTHSRLGLTEQLHTLQRIYHRHAYLRFAHRPAAQPHTYSHAYIHTQLTGT